MNHTKNPDLYNNDASALGTLLLMVYLLVALPIRFALDLLVWLGEWADEDGYHLLHRMTKHARLIIGLKG